MAGELDAIYINRESGARCHVTAVDAGYAYLLIELGGGKTSRYSMPIAEYDGDPSIPAERHFINLWRPATPEDLQTDEAPLGFRPPKNQLASALSEAVDLDERVSIGGDLG